MADSKISALPAATTPLAGTEVLPIVQGGATVKVAVSNLTAGRAVTALTLNGNTITTGTGVLTIAAGKTLTANDTVTVGTAGLVLGNAGGLTVGASKVLTVNNILTVAGTDSTTMTFPTTSATIARTDAAQTFTGDQTLLGNHIQGTAAKGINFTANTPQAGMTSQLLNWYEEGTWTPTQGAALTVVGAFSSSGKYTRIGRQVTLTGLLTGATSISCTNGVICGGQPFTPFNAVSGCAATSSVNSSSTLYCSGTNIFAVTALTITTTIVITLTLFI